MKTTPLCACLLYTSDAADERSSVDLGGRRIIKKKKNGNVRRQCNIVYRQRIYVVKRGNIRDDHGVEACTMLVK